MAGSAGPLPGERRLLGPQTTGREYRNLSRLWHGIRHDHAVAVPMRDGVRLLADIHRPDTAGRSPALVAISPYPRQAKYLGGPGRYGSCPATACA